MGNLISIIIIVSFIGCLNKNSNPTKELGSSSMNRSGIFYHSGYYSYSIDMINPENPTLDAIVKIKFKDSLFTSSICFMSENDTIFTVVPKGGIELRLIPNNYEVIAYRGIYKIPKNKLRKGYVEFNFDIYPNEEVSFFISLGYGGIF